MTKISKAKISLSITIAVGLAAPQFAFAQSSPLSDLYACQLMSDSRAQLSCFMSETAKLQAAESSGVISAAPPVAPPAVISVAPIESESLAAERESLLLEAQRLAAERDRVKAEETRIAALEKEKEVATAKQSEEEDFGLVRDQSIKKRTLAIASTEKYGPRDYIRFTLENGEVWQQTQAGRFLLKRNKPNSLTIKRASFGSFLGRANDKGQSVRIRRVK